MGPSPFELEGNLLQVQDDVGGIFDDAGDGLELVQHAFDLDRGDGGALDRGQQGAAQRIPNGGAEAAFKGLGAELAVIVGQRLGIDRETFRLLESSPNIVELSFPARQHVAMHFAAAAHVLLRLKCSCTVC